MLFEEKKIIFLTIFLVLLLLNRAEVPSSSTTSVNHHTGMHTIKSRDGLPSWSNQDAQIYPLHETNMREPIFNHGMSWSQRSASRTW